MRLARHTPRRSGRAFGMRRMRHRSPRTLNRLDDGQAPASLETAGLQNFASRLGDHPLHKAMFTLARNALGLPGSLHNSCIVPFPPDMLSDYTRAAWGLSI